MRLKDLLDAKGDGVITVQEGMRVQQAAQVMTWRAVGALVVVAGPDELRGVISEREIVLALAQHGKAALAMAVADLTPPERSCVSPDDSVRNAMAIMTERRVRHLPVVQAGRIVGLISLGDTVKVRLNEKPAENVILHDIARWPDLPAASHGG